MLRRYQSGDWTFQEVRAHFWKIYLSNQYLVLTGAQQLINLPVDFFHRLVRFEVTQRDTTDVLSRSDLSIVLGKVNDRDVNMSIQWIFMRDLKNNQYALTLGETSEREPVILQFAFTGTTTNKIYPILYLMEA